MSERARKKEIRGARLRSRRGQGEDFLRDASALIGRRLSRLASRLGWRFISCYIGFESEVRTEDFLRECLGKGIRVAVPYVGEGARLLYFSEVKDLDKELAVNRFGIREPRREYLRPVPVGALDAIIVPGTAFDPAGNRLGYGQGFYDRTLGEAKGKIPLIGLAFSGQVVESVPAEEHDVAMDMVVTENGIYTCGGGSPACREAVYSEEES